MSEFHVGDRVFIDGDRGMMGTVKHLETQQQLSREQLFAHVQFDHLLGDVTQPGLLLPCQPKFLSLDLPEALDRESVEEWLRA